MKKLELSFLCGFAAMLFYFLLAPNDANAWWTSAFEPLCDGILSAEGEGETIIIRSKLLELWREWFSSPA